MTRKLTRGWTPRRVNGGAFDTELRRRRMSPRDLVLLGIPRSSIERMRRGGGCTLRIARMLVEAMGDLTYERLAEITYGPFTSSDEPRRPRSRA